MPEPQKSRKCEEAFLNLGFYLGEEDMEFSCFTSGTGRAIKTWQATMGTPGDGMMTAELFERLFAEQKIKDGGTTKNVDEEGVSLTFPEKWGENGAAIASVNEISELQQAIVDEKGVTEIEASQHRVFLIGENWSQLNASNQQASESKSKDAKTKFPTYCG